MAGLAEPRPGRIGTALRFGLAALLTGSACAGQVFYQTGFEPGGARPFAAGPLAGQGGWVVRGGTANIEAGSGARGAQAVWIGAGRCELPMAGVSGVVWVDLFLRTGGSAAPVRLSPGVAAQVIFSSVEGVLALDGDGRGHGVFVTVAPWFATNRYVRLTLRLDQVRGQYDVWLDGVKRRSGLGLGEAGGGAWAGLAQETAGGARLDDLAVASWGLDADSDGDGLTDLDEIQLAGTGPLEPDTDRDGAIDGSEWLAGTDPTRADSVLKLGVGVDAAGGLWVEVPTVAGRAYTLMGREDWSVPGWRDLPVGIPGDGTRRRIGVGRAGAAGFYRIRLEK
jgi:hypothetical protein